jgi:hypothetical protein
MEMEMEMEMKMTEFLGLFGEPTQSHIQEEPTQIKISNQSIFFK